MAKILAADDSASMRQMVSFTLKSKGHEIIQAVDGQEALTMAQRGAVDLVLTDLNMPKMDGLTLIRQLRKLPDYRFTPILMLTTEADASRKQEGKAVGATGWIVKPFNPEQLLKTIDRVLV
ncbi:MAG TPA: response regulator [Gammaproteobacteria bacterium]|nr:response regulator [Gammaproteobacteria bacterium]